jgi:hypothetical protein
MAFQNVSRSGSWFEGDPEQTQVTKIFPLIIKIQYMDESFKYRYPQCCGSGSGLDPDSMGSGSGFRRVKMSHKNRSKKLINFEVLDVLF